MASQTAEATQDAENEEQVPQQLYRHSKRPEWGMAILAWEKETRRAYQFEDGTLRKIKKGYYDLLDPVEDYDGPADAVRSNLRAAIRSHKGTIDQEILEPVCAFKEQIWLFEKMYPKGFQDPKWIEDHRGEPDKASLKRHREGSKTAMQEALDPSRAKQLISGGNHAELTESVLDVLAGTDLVPISHVKTLREMDEDQVKEYAEAVYHLAHGEGEFDSHFKEYLAMLERVLGSKPSWRVATCILALMYPQEHISVRRSAFIRQAGSIAPTGKYTRKPKLASYKSYRQVAFGVRKRVEAAGHEARDLLDIHDFIWETLRKSALKHLKGAD